MRQGFGLPRPCGPGGGALPALCGSDKVLPGLRLRSPRALRRGLRLREWRKAGAQGRARAALSTSSAWPFTFTLRQMRAIPPSRSMRKVERSTPQYLRPYMDFSFHVP